MRPNFPCIIWTIYITDRTKHIPLEVCLAGAKFRAGKKREDIPWTESGLDENFKQYIIDFPKQQRPQIYELIEKYRKDKNIIIFKSRKEADDYNLF